MKTPKWRAELARIVKFLNKKDGDSIKLWAVLTALRGPDFRDDYPHPIKRAITGVLRHQVGLVPLPNAMVNEIDSAYFVRTRSVYADHSGHFYSHAGSAFRALGLDWVTVNPKPVVRQTYKVARKKKAR